MLAATITAVRRALSGSTGRRIALGLGLAAGIAATTAPAMAYDGYRPYQDRAYYGPAYNGPAYDGRYAGWREHERWEAWHRHQEWLRWHQPYYGYAPPPPPPVAYGYAPRAGISFSFR